MPSHSEIGGMSIRYLGQVGFLLKRKELSVVIDPFLSESGSHPGSPWMRNYRPPIQPEALGRIDLVLCTHDHSDHTDPESLRRILAASPSCRFAGPRISAREIQLAGIDASQVIVLNEGTQLSFPDLIIEPVAAAHENYERDAEGYHRYLGYLLHWGGITVYHAGDTLVTPELEKMVGTYPIDIGFLPINGRDTKRQKQNIIGNMTAEEAVVFATNLAKRRGFHLLVPTHYDLYKCNGAELSHFVGIWEKTPEPKPSFKAFRPGEKMVYENL